MERQALRLLDKCSKAHQVLMSALAVKAWLPTVHAGGEGPCGRGELAECALQGS